jgi:hypothetical protein
MKKLIYAFAALLFTFLNSEAQDNNTAQVADTVPNNKIEKSANLNILFTQAGFENWAGGGENSIAVGSVFAGKFNVIGKKGGRWDNSLDVVYGLQRQQSIGQFRKTDDQLIFISKYGRKLKNKWSVAALSDFRTQITDGYKYTTLKTDSGNFEQRNTVSRFMAPGYLTIATGLEYADGDKYSFIFSPAANKVTFVLDDALSQAGAFGVEKGKKVRSQLGMQLTAAVKGNILENVLAQSRLNLFTSYDKGFGNIDVNWEGLIVLKVNKYLTTTLAAALIYDDDIKLQKTDGTVGPGIQFRQSISVGLSLALIK